MVPASVIWTSVVPAAVVAVAPVRSIIISAVSVSISIIRSTVIVVRTGSVKAGAIKEGNWDWEPERKLDTSTRGRFSDERQARKNQHEEDKLLHTNIGRVLPPI